VTEAAYVDMLLDQHVSGIIFFGGEYHEAGADHRHYHLLTDRGLPVVLINAAYGDLGFPRVSVDDANAIEQALAHLESLGHERIGIVLGPSDHVPSIRKLEAYLARERRERGPRRAHDLFDRRRPRRRQSGSSTVARQAGHCASDILALELIRQARRAGLDVPGDVSVVGFDDSALMMCTDPPLTTVRQPIEAMGQAAVRQLLSQVGGTPVSSEELLFEPELVVRASTGPWRFMQRGFRRLIEFFH
jgi:DNA-binding LacI/PurR family transcriptional regulator